MLMRLTCMALVAVGVAKLLFPATTEAISDSEKRQITATLERFVRTEHVNRRPWNEEATPLLYIDAIQHEAANVRRVRGCEFQPTLLSPGTRVEAVVVRTHQDWRVDSFNYLGVCKANVAALTASHDSDVH